MSTDLTLLTASQAAARIAAGDLTSEAYTRAFLDRIDERDPLIRAFVWVDRQAVLAAARERDRGPWRGPLHGLPIAVKDVINTRDAPTQHNSPVYEGHRPAEDANCVGVLRGAGALMLGKTDTAEFASAGRQPVARNPRRPTHTPGGSSSGSAAAVADRMAPLALGTQTGGSTIRPASFCGVHAMKPTFGRISVQGVKQYSAHLDTIGLFGRSVEDLWLFAEAYRILDGAAFSLPDCASITIGLCETPQWPRADADARAALHEAARLFAAAGVRIRTLQLDPEFDALIEAQQTLMHEGGRAAFLPEYLQSRSLLHDDFVGMVENRRGFTPARMRDALDRVAVGRSRFDALAAEVDAVLVPSAPGQAPEGFKTQGDAVFNRIWTALGVPCVNLPGLKGAGGLPVGVQLLAPRFEDARLLNVAAALSPIVLPGGISP